LSFIKQIRELWDHLRGKGPAAAVALTLDLSEARDNKPYMLEAGAAFVEFCDGDLYAKINGPNGDGINLRYVKKILYPVTSLYLTNTAQAGKSARLLLLPTGMDADPPPFLSQLRDVSLLDLADHDVLSWEEVLNAWVNLPPELLPIYLNQCLDTAIIMPSDGEVLTWVGASELWQNRSVPAAHAISYLEGNTDINTSSVDYVDFLGELSTSSSFYLNVVAGKRVLIQCYAPIRANVAGSLAIFVLLRSGTAGGPPSAMAGAAADYCATGNTTLYTDDQYPMFLFYSFTPAFTGRLNLLVRWKSPSGNQINSDGGAINFRRKGLAIQFLA